MLSVNNIFFKYEDQNTLKGISFELTKGTYLSIMGESGCGKSTLLKAIYGLLDLDKGVISYNKEKLLGPKHHLVPGHSFMKFLRQDLNIMPYTSVFDNIAEHLSRFNMQLREERTLELIEVVDLMALKDVKVKKLSGGQKQRVALAKVLAKEPEILLLDEPFSQIDHFRKKELRYRLFSYLKEKNISCITATHDKDDVLPFADEVLIMRNGKIRIKNAPQQVYCNPIDRYTASLFSEVNEVPANLFGSQFPNKKIILYPHEIIIDQASNKTNGEVKHCYFAGDNYILKVKLDNSSLTIKSRQPIRIGEKVIINCSSKLVISRIKNK